MFRLYLRDGGVLNYREAWGNGGRVVEHWGVCGQTGEVREHAVEGDAHQQRLLEELETEAGRAGFKAIPIEEHAGVLVECPVDGFGTEEDLHLRHELEELLDEVLGWTGLGFCDGGSIGSGSMEAFCLVVDGPLAIEVIQARLVGTKFGRFVPRIERS